MKGRIFLLVMFVLSIGCSRSTGRDPIGNLSLFMNAAPQGTSRSDMGQYLKWGLYNLEIGRDGSYGTATLDRTASGEWGYHLNVVKLLEVAPCMDCLKLSNIHLTAGGDVSVDISIRHPWPADNKYCTGFDVKGIIMFPASQNWPDDDLWIIAGIDDPGEWKGRWSSHEKGDAELTSPDGWTTIFSPDNPHPTDHDLDEGLPIFGYYPGKWASGENLGTINAFKRYYSNETRHMFEAGKTVTRTYIIRPPSDGPIQASYAIYAHWAPPVKTPVVNPATDFGPEANSPMPYEFYITQDAPIDPDAPSEVNGAKIHWHVKLWNDYFKTKWVAQEAGIVDNGIANNDLMPDPNGEPDDYVFAGPNQGPSFYTALYPEVYENQPDFLPAEVPYIFRLNIKNPDTHTLLSLEWHLLDVAMEAPDGEW